eukprot:COSAG01_NODE_54492_length_331_cov_4.000000_1_plen_36_part_10
MIYNRFSASADAKLVIKCANVAKTEHQCEASPKMQV